MASSWSPLPPSRSELPREFLVSAELYVSNAAGATLPKPVSRKKADKREPTKTTSHQILDDNVKVKEKSSWIGISRGPAATGQWRSATCRLSEEGERCLLNVYVDESILFQTVYIHLLNQTDIRQTDSSLFFRKDCIGIYCATGQRWTLTQNVEPVYLQFSNTDACHTWLSLLRSYAIPEIYGRWFFTGDGGSYRMWRQVELTILQGRGLGTFKAFEPNDGQSDADTLDHDLCCDIHLNDTICGRTTVKKGIGSPDWHESFSFPDLPPFETLDIVVWREKKSLRWATLGSVRIPLSTFRRGEGVEGWFPVLHSGPVASDLQVGELRLKVRVDEEIILPYHSYSGLLATFNSRNFLDWMSDFESKLKLKTVSSQLMSVAVARNVLIEQVQALASREVDGTPSSHQTLFRGNTILTKVIELCMAWYGKPFLEASVGGVLRKICAEKVAIEVDPMRSGKGTKDVERNVELLIVWCREFWNQIYSVRMECPQEMRRLFETIRKLVESRYQADDQTPERNKELPWQSVSAFCFLRFIVPAILHPHLFGLCPGLPSPQVQRSLTLIAKVIQSLANLNATVQKEEFMRGVGDFLKDSVPSMIDYIRVVSTPSLEGYPLPSEPVADRLDRLRVVNSLRQRASVMPSLEREAIPILPHLLDIPRHMSIITSAVIRNSWKFTSKDGPRDPEDNPLHELCSKCFEVEEIALLRVSQLASKISADRRRASASVWTQVSTPSIPAGANPPTSPNRRRVRKNGRPSTAPSASETDTSRRKVMMGTLPSAHGSTSKPTESRPATSTAQGSQRPTHMKSPSTDSLPAGAASQRFNASSSTTRFDPPTDMSDDLGRKKKGIFRGIFGR